ncbi:hypothetical protein GCM10023085_47810 [Actinomadura viridis]|uniref:Uncharacterized protein n=1 Tax=Actinomadura viridis TaxID=58110 RepID=A0A931DMJ1_9ACTN|nr:hypothetical protein [Actinomadura viridis]MBG6090717.1 hypothetical protein [Actinomadura viridis]
MKWFRRDESGDAGTGPSPAPVVADPVITLVCAVVESHGYTCTVIDGDQVELGRPGDSSPSRMYLSNLRQWVAREPEDQWPAIVSDFVGTLIATTEVEDEEALDLADFALIRPLLRTRLYADDFQAGMEVVRRTVAPGLAEVLVVDKPTSLLIVSTGMAADWPVGRDELFHVARENVRSDGPLEMVEDDAGGVPIFSLGAETAYVTAHALWAGDYPVTGPHGALVAVPAQGVVHASPVHPGGVPAAMNVLIRVAWAGFQEGPRSISPNVYWWDDGELRLAGAVEAGEDALTVSIGEDFQALLEHLVRD